MSSFLHRCAQNQVTLLLGQTSPTIFMPNFVHMYIIFITRLWNDDCCNLFTLMNDVRPYISTFLNVTRNTPFHAIYSAISHTSECNKHSEKNFSQFTFNYKSKKQMSLCQKVVHRSGTYVVKIKHQNCLLQVFKDYILTYKKLNGFKPYLWCTT